MRVSTVSKEGVGCDYFILRIETSVNKNRAWFGRVVTIF